MMITNEQRQLLEDVLARGPNSQGNYADAYALILSWVSDSNQVDDNVKLWFMGAIQANAGKGTFSALIREYSSTQMALRGVGYSDQLMQEASNRVAERAIQEILNTNSFPSIDVIANMDAIGVGEILFASLGSDDTAGQNINAGWSGTILFHAFDSQQIGRLLTAGDAPSLPGLATQLNRLDDVKNVLFAYHAYEQALAKAAAANVEMLTNLDIDQWLVDLHISGLTFASAISANNLNKNFLTLLDANISKHLVGDAKKLGELIEDIGTIGAPGVEQVLSWLISTYEGKALVVENGQFATKATQFFSNFSATQLQSKVIQLIDDPMKLALMAKTDANARAALAGLSPIVMEVPTAIANALTLHDPKTGTGEITEQWIHDRALALSAFMSHWRTNGPATDVGADFTVFNDFASGQEVQTFAFAPADSVAYVTFGADGNDVISGGKKDDHLYGGAGVDTLAGKEGDDYLEGNSGNDKLSGEEGNDELYGGTGNDELTGGEGHDLLIGGEGTDTYIFEGNFGTDRIIDSDGQGSITINGVVVSSLKPVHGAENVFRVNDDIEAIQFNDGSTNNLMIISRSGSADDINSVVIKNWKENDLGISVAEPETQEFDANTSGVFNGDSVDNAIDIYDFRKTLPEGTDSSAIRNLVSNGGGGRDLLQGWLNGSDTLDGGDGDDFIIGGNQINGSGTYLLDNVELQGTDLLSGGAGQDYIVVSGKNSVAHGGADNDFIRADELWNIKIREYEADGSVSATDLNDVNRNQVWSDFSRFLSPNYSETSPGIFLLSPFDHTQTNPNWVPDTSVTGLPYYYLQREGNSSANSVVATTHYGDSAPEFGTNPVTGGWIIEGGFQVDFVSTNIQNYAISPEAYAAYQNQAGVHLYGDDGDDVIFGGIKSDYIFGGADKDIIWALGGHDFIDGGSGNDDIFAGDGNDIVMGGAGEDSLRGGDGNDYLYGGDDNVKDIISGGKGNDIIVVGKLDHVSGDEGDDIYIWDQHQIATSSPQMQPATVSEEGATSNSSFADIMASNTSLVPTEDTYIIDNKGNNTLALVGEQDFAHFSVDKSATHLLLNTGNNHQIILQDALVHASMNIVTGSSVEALAAGTVQVNVITDDTFLNGTNLLAGQQISTTALLLSNLQRTVNVTAAVANTYLAGGLIDDTLVGHIDGSRFIGGKGNDTFIGDMGNDTYLIRQGDGHDIITDTGGNNTLKLDKNITVNQLRVNRVGVDLLIKISDEQTIVVNNMFDAATGALIVENGVQNINFYDGTVWDIETIKQRALTGSIDTDVIGGFETNDILIGGKGNDQLNDQAGDDIYQYALGDGNDVITDASGNDRIELSGGILPDQVIVFRDVYNNLILKFSNGENITVTGAFDASGNFTSQAIETIQFSDASTWDAARILQEVAAYIPQNINGTDGDDLLIGDAVSDILVGGKGNDRILGGAGDDTYRYTLGDGNDVIVDVAGVDRIELSGITQDQLIARSNGRDLVLSFTDGGSLTVTDMFVSKSQTPVDPLITQIINELQTNWISQAEALIEEHYGLVGNGEITLNFERNGTAGVNRAHVEVIQAGGGDNPTKLVLSINLDAFAAMPNGSGPWYHDRNIAHEMVHAVMASNMSLSGMPGWFLEGTAELIQGADERVWHEMGVISNQNNFNLLFKTTAGSPTTNAGYAVSYIAVKFLDQEIRDNGGIGIRELFDELQTGKTLDQGLAAVSLAHNNMNGQWNNLASFEAYFKAVGFSSMDTLLRLSNADTGSIAGSDYGYAPLDANSVLSNIHIGPSKNFTIVIPDEYINSVGVHNEIESIHFSDSTVWNAERIQQEVVKGNLIGTDGDDVIWGTQGNDTLIGTDANDVFVGADGDDTYIYNLGDGNDVIVDTAGNDVIRLGFGSWLSDYSLNRDASNNLVIMFSDGGDIVVKDAFKSSAGIYNNMIEKIEFQDGHVIDVSEMNLQVTQGQELWANGSNFIRLIGTTNADTLHGGIGSDKLVGGFGNDKLLSGGGNDSMYGGSGDDIYEFNGSGAPIITDSTGVDTLHFYGADPAITKLYQSSTDLIVFVSAQSRVTLTDFFDLQGNVSDKAIEKIVFSNGSVWDSAYIQQHLLIADTSIVNGTNGDDEIHGGIGNDFISGFEGYDDLYGYEGADTLVGGKGHDNIFGGGGDDIYILRPDDGEDFLYESGGKNVIQLEDYIETDENGNVVYVEHIAEADVRLKKEYSTQFRLVTDHGASVLLFDMFDNTTGALKDNAIHAIHFANGVEWDYARMQQEMLRYTDGNDSIEGFDRDNNLYGGKGNDSLTGTSFNDSLNGGQGSDYLNGQDGNDTYHYALGDGADIIYESSGIDTLVLGAGIDPADVYVSIDTQKAAIVLILPNVGRITFASMLDIATFQLNEAKKVEFIKFHNGDTWTAEQLLDKARNPGVVVIQGDALNNTLEGTSSNDLIIGGKGSDTISGSDGDDHYAFSSSDFSEHSNDWIEGFDNGFDTVQFTSGITEENIQVRFSPGVSNTGFLHIALFGNEISGAIYVGGMYSGGSVGFGIEQLVFANGNSWSLDRIKAEAIKATDGNDFIYAYNSDDILGGGKGDDDLAGQGGNDTYIFNAGDGDDNILDIDGNDSLYFGEGISSSDIIVRRSGSFTGQNLELRVSDADAITIVKVLNSSGSVNTSNVIESINFESGEVWDISRLLAESIKGSTKADDIYGYATNDVIRGGKGYDQMHGYGGNDTYQFGIGDEMGIVIESAGSDTIEFLPGISPDDIIVGRSGTNLFIHTTSGDEVKIQGMFTSSGGVVSSKAIEFIKFADNTVWDTAKILQEVSLTASNTGIKLGSDNNDTLTGGAGDELIYGESGNDILRGMDGNDILVSGVGRDTLYGGSGNDLLISSFNFPEGYYPLQFDTLYGGVGDDIYRIQSGSKFTYILNDHFSPVESGAGFDVLELPEGVTESDIQVRILDSTLYGPYLLEIKVGSTDVVYIDFDFTSTDYLSGMFGLSNSPLTIESIRFFNGLEWSLEHLFQEATNGSDADDIILGSLIGELISGGSGNDTLSGRGGNDTLVGGAGNDIIKDDSALDNEVYRFGRGDGHDVISDLGGIDSLEFGEGITLAHISVSRSDESLLTPNNQMGSDLILSLNTGETVRISDVFVVGSTNVKLSNAIDNFYFTDGSQLSFSDLLLLLSNSTIDETAPAQPSAAFNSLGSIVNGIAEAGSTVVVKNTSGTILGSVVADITTGSYSIGLTVALINKEMVNVSATDVAGNVSIVKAIIAPDLTPPEIPTATFETAGEIITGVAEANSTVIIKNVFGDELGRATADGINGTYSVTLLGALIDKETVNVTAMDGAGNVSGIQVLIAPDKTPPAAPTANLDAAAKTVSGIAESGSTVTVKDSVGQTLGVVQADPATGTYTVSFAQALIDGQSIFTTAMDAAGNISPATSTPIVIPADPQPTANGLRGSFYGYHQPANGNVNLTNVAQVLGVIASKAPDATFVATRLQYAGSASLGMGTNLQTFLNVDAASLSGDPTDTSDAIIRFDGKIQLDAGNYNFRVRADDGYSLRINGVVVAEHNANQGATTRTHTTFAVGQSGLQDIEIIYWDANGGNTLNVELRNLAVGTYHYLDSSILFTGDVVTVDTTPPDSPTATFDINGATINGVSEANSLVVVKSAAGDVLGTATADAVSGIYNIALPAPLIDQEAVNVTAQDSSGNVSAITSLIAPDKTAPAAPTANLDVTTKEVSGVAEAGSSVTVTDSTGQTLGTAQADITTGAYTVSFTQALVNGQSISTTAMDTAGNISPATSTPIILPVDPQPIATGLRSSFYGYHQPANGNINLTNVAQVLGVIASKAPDATFVATRLQYAGSASLGMGTNLQTFLNVDAASLSGDPTDTSDAIIRFDGKIQLDAGNYNFRVRADDGYSLRINGVVVAEHNANQGVTTRTHATFTVGQSGLQDIEIIYWDANGGNALNVELRSAATGVYSYLDESILFQSAANPETVALVSESSFTESTHYFNTNDALIQAMATFAPYSGVANHYRAAYSEQHIMTIAANS